MIRVDFGSEWRQGGLNWAVEGVVNLNQDLIIFMMGLRRLFSLVLLSDNFAILFLLKYVLQ